MKKQCARTIPARVGTDAFVRPAGQSPAARHRFLRWNGLVVALLVLFAKPFASAADCVPFQEASQHVDETECVTGKVIRVKVGESGVHFLDFCEDQAGCPFTVVVFSHALKDIGDVRRLAGRTIEIVGYIKLYEGRPEIILNRIQPDPRRCSDDPATATPEELRCRESRPLQCRATISIKEAHEDESCAEPDRDVRLRRRRQ